MKSLKLNQNVVKFAKKTAKVIFIAAFLLTEPISYVPRQPGPSPTDANYYREMQQIEMSIKKNDSLRNGKKAPDQSKSRKDDKSTFIISE